MWWEWVEIKLFSPQKCPPNPFVLSTATDQSKSANYQNQELESRADWPVVIKPVWWSGGQAGLRIVLSCFVLVLDVGFSFMLNDSPSSGYIYLSIWTNRQRRSLRRKTNFIANCQTATVGFVLFSILFIFSRTEFSTNEKSLNF